MNAISTFQEFLRFGQAPSQETFGYRKFGPTAKRETIITNSGLPNRQDWQFAIYEGDGALCCQRHYLTKDAAAEAAEKWVAQDRLTLRPFNRDGGSLGWFTVDGLPPDTEVEIVEVAAGECRIRVIRNHLHSTPWSEALPTPEYALCVYEAHRGLN